VRGFLLDKLRLPGTDPGALLRRLDHETDVSARRALILALSEFPAEEIPAASRRSLAERLMATYCDDPDPGLHSAADCLLRRWGHEKELRAQDQALASRDPQGPRRWYVNRQGHTLAVVSSPGFTWLGSPGTEPGRNDLNELLRCRPIPRAFAIATREVTHDQYLESDKSRGVPGEPRKAFGPDRPPGKVMWYEAAKYCNWLSEKEGIPKDQWCYLPNRHGQYAEGMGMPADYLERTGYRLPTDAEWEYACRAGAWTSRPYGHAPELLGRYAWHAANARSSPQPVARLLPNDLGLFDMLGNVSEWTDDPLVELVPDPLSAARTYHLSRSGPRVVRNAHLMILRGGDYLTPAGDQRSAAVPHALPPWLRYERMGFRIVRTIRASP
jgi:formylglycine-generating enzyme required for sulfatase activity